MHASPDPPGNPFTRALRRDDAPLRGLGIAFLMGFGAILLTYTTSVLPPLVAFTDGWHALAFLSLALGPALAIGVFLQVPERRYGLVSRSVLVVAGMLLVLSAPGPLALGHVLVGVRHSLTLRRAQRIVEGGDPAPRGAETWLAVPLRIEESASGDLDFAYDMAFPIRCRASISAHSRATGGRLLFTCTR